MIPDLATALCLLTGTLDKWEQPSAGEQHAYVEGSLLNNKVFNERLCRIVRGDASQCQEAILIPMLPVVFALLLESVYIRCMVIRNLKDQS